MTYDSSIIETELKAVEDVTKGNIQSGYLELTEMCQKILAVDSEIIPSFSLLVFHVCEGKDVEKAISAAYCYNVAFGGIDIHERISNEGKVVGIRKKRFSQPVSATKVVVAGDFLYAMGFRKAYQSAPEITSTFVDACSSICDGNFITVDKSFDTDITEEECVSIMAKRSSEKFSAIAKGMVGIAEGSSEHFERMMDYARNFGIALQVMNDLYDLVSKPEGNRKNGYTFQCGMPTIPLLFSMQDGTYGEDIRKSFANGSKTDRDVKNGLKLIVKTNMSERSKEFASGYVEKAVESLSGMPDSEYKKALIDFTRSIVW